MYKEVASINLDYWKFDVHGRELTHGQVLDRILEAIELYYNINDCFTKKYGADPVILWETQPKLAKEIWDLWGTVFPGMWW